MDALSKLIAMIMVIILLTLFPLQYMLEHQVSQATEYAESKIERITNEVRDKGYIDTVMYEGLLRDLSNTGMLFDIEIEHAALKQGEDIASIDELPGVSVVSSNLMYLPDFRESSATNSSIQSFAAHTHTGDCYTGHIHTGSCTYSGYSSYIGGHKNATYYMKATRNTSLIYITIYCSTCFNSIGSIHYYYNSGLNTAILANTNTLHTDGSTRWVSSPFTTITRRFSYDGTGYTANPKWETVLSAFNNIDPAITGSAPNMMGYYNVTKEQLDAVGFYSMLGCYSDASANYSSLPSFPQYFCYKEYNQYGSMSDLALLENGTLNCHNVVTSITPSYPINYVGYGQMIASTAIATYLDGHTATVNCSLTGFNPYQLGAQTATLTYSGLVDNARTTGTKICTTTTIVSNYVTAITPVTPSQTVLYGGTPDVRATVTYMNGATEVVNCSISGYQNNVLGAQTCTLTYLGMTNASGINLTCTITVTVKNYITNMTAYLPEQIIMSGGIIDNRAIITMANGLTETVSCSVLNISNTVIGKQSGGLIYYGDTNHLNCFGDNASCVMTVTVLENKYPTSLGVVPSSNSVYNGNAPTYTVTVYYSDSTATVITSGYSASGWSSGAGTKTVSFSYTEKGRMVTTSIVINVKPNLSALSVSPASQTIERYKTPIFFAIASYEDGSTTTATSYDIAGFNNTIIGKQDVTLSVEENGITKSYPVVVEVTPMRRNCTECHTTYYLDGNDFDQGCPVCKGKVASITVSPAQVQVPKNSALPITVTATFNDGHTKNVDGWTSDFNATAVGMRVVSIKYQDNVGTILVNVTETKICSICSVEYALNDYSTDPGCPTCSGYIIAVSASPVMQTVTQGGSLSLTVTALYRDGHSDVITGWTSDFNSDISGPQHVTVYYASRTFVVNVTVKSVYDVTCSICGEIYNSFENPWGCPICSRTVVGIDAALKNNGTRTPYGEPLSLRVILTYRDGHRAMVYGGWVDDFQPTLLGIQTVSISYTDSGGDEVSCYLSVQVVYRVNSVVCMYGHQYYPENEGAPCPYCDAWTMNEREALYFSVYTDEILDRLYKDGMYYFKPGDYVSFKVKINIQRSIYTFTLFGKRKEELLISCGGEIA